MREKYWSVHEEYNAFRVVCGTQNFSEYTESILTYSENTYTKSTYLANMEKTP